MKWQMDYREESYIYSMFVSIYANFIYFEFCFVYCFYNVELKRKGVKGTSSRFQRKMLKFCFSFTMYTKTDMYYFLTRFQRQKLIYKRDIQSTEFSFMYTNLVFHEMSWLKWCLRERKNRENEGPKSWLCPWKWAHSISKPRKIL